MFHARCSKHNVTRAPCTAMRCIGGAASARYVFERGNVPDGAWRHWDAVSGSGEKTRLLPWFWSANYRAKHRVETDTERR
ncbi:hypothetical protein BGZ61DRAFT_443913 [Ilyonectria robusta]|uniref:uncharacterized protein n=1 Tax=Ilyonectria robusta TaxID=1079257 RepID=UPI001E8D5DA1|nr:uncharacterized protein BGZ61DRAFT_443913 [Ilyonectria robusta]KAH8735210.1 hypothetical protein BGZ61DRAFT_443913 [Ilyonectria robusta]